MRRAAKVDANQARLVAVMRAAGASVQHLHTVGQGVPDLLVGYRGVNGLAEVKMPKAKLTPDETRWHASWRGAVDVLRTEDDAMAFLGHLAAISDAEWRRGLDKVRAQSAFVLACAKAPERAEPHSSPLYEGLNRLAREDARKRGGKP